MGREADLLYNALCYEQGHSRRTQHILKVYALAGMLGEREKLSPEEMRILRAAAILHDIAIRYCKEHCQGDASQTNQRKAAPSLVRQFLEQAGYPDQDYPRVLALVEEHHNYQNREGRLLQLLMEADLIVNCYEEPPVGEQIPRLESIFETAAGKELFSLCLQELKKKGN